MKERPILMNGAMVRAVLDESKTQTRRPIKPAPEMVEDKRIETWAGDPAALLCLLQASKRSCPHGQPGDHLWVRETFVAFGRWETRFSDKKKRDEWHFVDMTLELGLQYKFDGADLSKKRYAGAMPTWCIRPSIFMPRAASRIHLEIVSVRVERLQDISDADIVAEGTPGGHGVIPSYNYHATPSEHFSHLWESINGAGSWAANPWLWVIEFKRVAP